MAATVGATISSCFFPARHTNLGPFKSSAGNYYFIGRNVSAASSGNIRVFKASAPLSSFADTGTSFSGSGAVHEAIACYQVSDVIHIVAQLSTGQVFYNNYNMSTDAWAFSTAETAVAAASQAPVTGTTFVDLVVRSGGEVVIAYNAGQTAMNSTLNMIRGTRRTGTNTYSALAANIDNGGSTSWTGCVAALGASGRVHFFFRNGLGDAFQRTLTAANALQTFPATFDTTNVAATMGYGNALSYTDGATTRVRALYGQAASVAGAKIAKQDSSDTPTTTATLAGDNAGRSVNSQRVLFLANDSTDLHILYSDSAATDLYHDVSTDGGTTWGTDTNELAGTINAITANVYDRSGTKLAMVLDDGGTIKYAEIGLAAATVLTQTTFRGRNDDGNETTATWKAAAGADWTQNVDENFRVRFLVSSTVAPPTQFTNLGVHYSHNGGTYTFASTSASVVRSVSSSNMTNSDNLTEQLAGTGNYNIGKFTDTGEIAGFQLTPATGDDTEMEYSLQIRGVDVSNGDTISLRLYTTGTTPLNGGYTDSPLITVNKPATSFIWPTETAYRILSRR